MEKLFTKMSNITRRYLKNFKNDFLYDKELIEQKEKERFFVWIVRKNGTHICLKDNVLNYEPYAFFIDNDTVRYYELDTKKQTVTAIKDRKEYLEICELLKISDGGAV